MYKTVNDVITKCVHQNIHISKPKLEYLVFINLSPCLPEPLLSLLQQCYPALQLLVKCLQLLYPVGVGGHVTRHDLVRLLDRLAVGALLVEENKQVLIFDIGTFIIYIILKKI